MIFHFLHAHQYALKWIIIVSGAVVAAGLIWRFALRPWLRNIRYSRRNAAHARPAPLADPVWGDTGQHDTVWDREVAEPEPGYFPDSADDYATMLHTGSLLEPLPGHPYPRAWEQDRPVRTANLPPWELEDRPADPGPRRQELMPLGVDRPWEADRPELPLGATHRDGMTGGRDLDTPAGDRSPESGSLSPRTARRTPASVTAGRAPRAWSGLLGAPDPQNLLVPDPTVSPAPAPTAGLPVRDEQPDLSGPAETAQGTRTPLGFPGCRVGEPGLAGQDGTGVLTGEIHPGPLPEPEDDEPPTVTITVISAADTGPWADDGWATALPGYIAEHLPDGCQSTSDYLDAMFDGITGTAQLALTAGGAR